MGGSDDIVASEDAVRTEPGSGVRRRREKNSIEVDKKDANRATLLIGNDEWPLPIPIVKKGGKWVFDTKTGREEILLH